MNAKTDRNVSLTILAVFILGVAFWWWQGSPQENKGKTVNSPQAMVNTTASEAKEEATKMTMDVASMNITDIEAGRIKLANQVIIKNPLPVKLTADRLDYAVLINGTKVAEGTYNQPIVIPASGSKTVTLPMQVVVKEMDKVIDEMDAAGKDIATYTFLNTVYTDVPIAGERKIPFNIKEELPIVRLPKMRVGDIDISDFGLKNSGMDIVMQVTNRNAFPIRMEDGKYSMTIDGETTMTGTMQEVVTLPAKETVPVTMHAAMKTGRAMKMGWKMLFNKKDTRYKLTFDSKILSESKLLKNSNMHFDEEGKLQDLKKELKKARE